MAADSAALEVMDNAELSKEAEALLKDIEAALSRTGAGQVRDEISSLREQVIISGGKSETVAWAKDELAKLTAI